MAKASLSSKHGLSAAAKAKSKPKAKAKAKASLSSKRVLSAAAAKAKAKAKTEEEMPVLKAKDKKKVLAAEKKAAALKAAAVKADAVKKKPAAAWDEWAHEKADGDDDAEECEEMTTEKDITPVTKQQAFTFQKALNLPPGARGSLPQQVHDLWITMAHGPGTPAERNALRNLLVPRDAGQEGSAEMQQMKQVFAIKQRKHKVFGVSETEMLVTQFHDNRDRMQEAIDKGDVTVNGKYFYWERDIHEEITGGKVAFHFDGGNPNQMSNQDIQAMLKLLEFAPWAEWGAKPESECPKAALKAPAQPDGEAMGKLQEGSDAMQAAC